VRVSRNISEVGVVSPVKRPGEMASAVGQAAALASLKFGDCWSRHRVYANRAGVSQLFKNIFAEATLHTGDETPVLVGLFLQVSRTAGTPLEPEHLTSPHDPSAMPGL
jgi:hypothetical protein